MHLTAFDWAMLLALTASGLMGLWRGLVFEVLSVCGWAAAFLAARWGSPVVAEWLPADWSELARTVLGYVVIFAAGALLFGAMASLARVGVRAAGMRPADRLLGAMFGLLRGALVLLAAAAAIEMTSLQQSDWWTQSRGAPYLRAGLAGLKPALPEAFGRYLP
jgi:membrane protein required for colicin V production